MTDRRTLRYYSKHAGVLYPKYHTAGDKIVRRLGGIFKAGERVLDIGAGSGRDVQALLKTGVAAIGLEPCEKFISLAENFHPALRGKIHKGSLPGDVKALKGERFDGILCIAVLMHVPDAELSDSFEAIGGLMRDSGRLVISVPAERDDVAKNRDKTGRLMVLREPSYYQLVLEKSGFRLIRCFETEDALDRSGMAWSTMIFTGPVTGLFSHPS